MGTFPADLLTAYLAAFAPRYCAVPRLLFAVSGVFAVFASWLKAHCFFRTRCL